MTAELLVLWGQGILWAMPWFGIYLLFKSLDHCHDTFDAQAELNKIQLEINEETNNQIQRIIKDLKK